MKTSFFGRKLSQMGVGAVMAGISAMASMPAQAEIQAVALEFKDLNSRGGFISLDKLNSSSLQRITWPLLVVPTHSTMVIRFHNTLHC